MHESVLDVNKLMVGASRPEDFVPAYVGNFVLLPCLV